MGRHRGRARSGRMVGRWVGRSLAVGAPSSVLALALGAAAPRVDPGGEQPVAYGVTGRLGAPPAFGSPPTDPPAGPGAPTAAGAQAEIPARILAAYDAAAADRETADPSCGIDRALVAAIGKVESDHAGGGRVDADGRATPPIRGPVLDGSTPDTAVLVDTDGGLLDGDPVWERAVGPTQFLPATWAARGVDADGDGVADPGDVDDAAAATATYTCASGGDLRDAAAAGAAVLTYNRSSDYVATVRAWAHRYRRGESSRCPTPRPRRWAPTHARARPCPAAGSSTPRTPAPWWRRAGRWWSCSRRRGLRRRPRGARRGRLGGNGLTAAGSGPSMLLRPGASPPPVGAHRGHLRFLPPGMVEGGRVELVGSCHDVAASEPIGGSGAVLGGRSGLP